MNVVKAIRDYINKMVSEPGMKVLLLDEYTTTIVSLVYTQSEILQKEVYLIERVDNLARESMPHLRCVAFLKPIASSIDALCTELKKPKYGSYEIYLSNVCKSVHIDRLAEADEHEAVREIHEYFADFLALSPSLCHFNIIGSVGESPTSWSRNALSLSLEGISSLLLSLKKRPAIRYQGSSDLCMRLAGDVCETMARERELFDFRQSTEALPLLLILDRRDDPVTPLLHQWTYQAMVHDLVGIENNRVSLAKVPNISKELREIVLSCEQDPFFLKNMHANFGEIGREIRILVEEFQKKTKNHENIQSIEDMKSFIESYPQFRSMSGTVSKHVSLIGELSRLVDIRDLLNESEIEQQLACQKNHAEIAQSLPPLLASPKILPADKARLVMLYALRYEKQSSSLLLSLLEALDEEHRALVSSLLRFCGSSCASRVSDIFGTKGATSFLKNITSGLKGVENIYTQHTPLLATTLEQLAKGKLKDTQFPYFDKATMRDRVQDVIVFFVGGTTYAEAKVVAEFNEANPTMRVLLAGTCVHNFSSFCEEISKAQAR